MKFNDEYIEDANLDEILVYAEYIIQYVQVTRIVEQLRNNPSYYLSVNNRRLLEEWLRNYDKSMRYVA